MKLISGTRQFQIEEPTVVTIGKFDGRHKGHQKLLKEILMQKEVYGYRTAVFTFDLSPLKIVRDEKHTVITTNEERRHNMEMMGIDYLVEYPFDHDTACISPEDFVRVILVGQMNAKAIAAGTDCGFGYQRAGDAALLKELAPKYGYRAIIIEKAQDQNRDISSSYIREELNKGNIEKANELLGEPYTIAGTVVHGNHIGGPVLGFPTANILPPPEKHLPPFGVYISRVSVAGNIYGGVSNIGKKPTVQGDNPVGVETFILGLEKDLYGEHIEVQLLHFSRPERKFDSLDELKAQIERDKEAAMVYYEMYGMK